MNVKLIAATLGAMALLGTPVPVAAETLEERVERLERQVQEQEKRAEEAPAQPNTFRLYWKNGIRGETADKAFQFKIGGRIQNDFAFFTEDRGVKDAVGDLENGAEIRRARLYISGLIYDRVEFKAQYDFAGGDSDFKDVYLGLKDLPYVGNVRVGHMKEPFSLDELTSSKYITFMERALPNAFAPGRNIGLMVFDTAVDDRIGWTLGGFRDTDDFAETQGDGGWNITGRVTGLPIFEDGGRRLVHLGVAARHGDPGDDEVRFRQRPEAHLAERLVDTGTLGSDGLTNLVLEAATVFGPFSLQGEYFHNWADVEPRDVEFNGYYAQASVFLTGEHRRYKTGTGAFDRVKVKKPFLFDDNGPGAWELAARYSHIDLDHGLVRGGELNDWTGGVNWHLNDNTRIMANYVFGNRPRLGDVHGFQTRFQIDF